MNVGEMQRKLAVWSTENRERTFDRLLRVIANREWLMEAATKTLASAGAKMSIATLLDGGGFWAEREL